MPTWRAGPTGVPREPKKRGMDVASVNTEVSGGGAVFHVTWQGIVIRCESAEAALAMVDAIARRSSAPAQAPKPKLATNRKSGPRAVAKVAPAAGEKKPGRGRQRSWDEKKVRALHPRYAAGESLAELAPEAGIQSATLWLAFKSLGLPTGKAARTAAAAQPAVPVRRLPAGESRKIDTKGGKVA